MEYYRVTAQPLHLSMTTIDVQQACCLSHQLIGVKGRLRQNTCKLLSEYRPQQHRALLTTRRMV